MSIQQVIAGLIALGHEAEDIIEAAESATVSKKKPAAKAKAKESAAPAPKGKAKKGASLEDKLEDLSEEELVELAVSLDLGKAAKLKKMDTEELIELILEEDEEEVLDALEELVDEDEDDEDEDDEDEDDEDEDEVDYDDMDKDELVELVVERGLAKKVAAKKMDEDELIDLLEEDDEA